MPNTYKEITLKVPDGIPMEEVVDMTEYEKARQRFAALPQWAQEEILRLRRQNAKLEDRLSAQSQIARSSRPLLGSMF